MPTTTESLASWLDERLPEWRSLSTLELSRDLRTMFRAGEYARLNSAARNQMADAVELDSGFYATVTIAR